MKQGALRPRVVSTTLVLPPLSFPFSHGTPFGFFLLLSSCVLHARCYRVALPSKGGKLRSELVADIRQPFGPLSSAHPRVENRCSWAFVALVVEKSFFLPLLFLRRAKKIGRRLTTPTLFPVLSSKRKSPFEQLTPTPTLVAPC